VQCDHCERWVHQICGLFNKGRNDEDMPYICPMCLLDGAPRAACVTPLVHPV
jgi:E1A/CREB-binding protein